MSVFSKLKQIKDLREKAKHVQSVLGNESVEGSGSWGKVKVKMTGNQEITEVTIADELVGKKTDIETGVKEAVNDAIKKVHRVMAEKMKDMGEFKL